MSPSKTVCDGDHYLAWEPISPKSYHNFSATTETYKWVSMPTNSDYSSTTFSKLGLPRALCRYPCQRRSSQPQLTPVDYLNVAVCMRNNIHEIRLHQPHRHLRRRRHTHVRLCLHPIQMSTTSTETYTQPPRSTIYERSHLHPVDSRVNGGFLRLPLPTPPSTLGHLHR